MICKEELCQMLGSAGKAGEVFLFFSAWRYYNNHRIAKPIESSIGFAAKRQVWQRMILCIIRPMLIAMNIRQSSWPHRAAEGRPEMDQTSFFTTSEQEAYARIAPHLLSVLAENWADASQLRLDVRKNYCSIVFGSSVVARLSAGSTPTLSILRGREPIAGAVEDGNFYKLSLPDLAEAEHYILQMQEALQSILDRVPKEFSCCSRYLACSDARACVNPDKDQALRCAYRKVLHSGRIYYGANRNV